MSDPIKIVDCFPSCRLSYKIMMEAYLEGWFGKEEPTELRMGRFCAVLVLDLFAHLDPNIRYTAISDVRFQNARIVEDPTMPRGEILFHNTYRPDLDVRLINVTC